MAKGYKEYHNLKEQFTILSVIANLSVIAKRINVLTHILAAYPNAEDMTVKELKEFLTQHYSDIYQSLENN